MVLGQKLGQIMSNVVIRFFSYFTWDNLLKQEAVVVKSYEWKFMAIIAKNSKL